METREHQADRIVERSSWLAGGAGLFPLPLVDVVLVSGVNLIMLKELAALYEVEYSESRAKVLLGALTAGSAPQALTGFGAASLLKGVPFIGQTIGAFAVSAFSAAATYAIGHLFIRHFESGGTLLDFKYRREHLQEEIRRGKDKVRGKDPDAPVPAR